MSWFRKKNKNRKRYGYSSELDVKLYEFKLALERLAFWKERGESLEEHDIAIKNLGLLFVVIQFLYCERVKALICEKITKRRGLKQLIKIEEERRKLNDQRT